MDWIPDDAAASIPAHLASILDSLAQNDDDQELETACQALSNCIGKGNPVEETEASDILNLVPDLLTIIESKALSENKRLFYGKGELSSCMW
eukprot:CAMPEP_0113722162 /NCGR_PEP_ID=MMETSP0038_2-20120614/37573_1 /TAXON_ID=2898 /ORGANISM="Cryptomonas paramecium" /LENGTH=91 /DNA_ID=CAMNT_0000651327 /DNA_START=14 /DNA_END=286 /DNA_ORIENTATION=- /assembly_acc=CAM_ASM_000170